MTRRQQGKARAAARARDGSVPFRRTASVASSRDPSADPTTSGSRSTTPAGDQSAKMERGNSAGEIAQVGTKRVAEDHDAGDQQVQKRARTENSAEGIENQGQDGSMGQHQRAASIWSESPSWLNTPEPEPQEKKPLSNAKDASTSKQPSGPPPAETLAIARPQPQTGQAPTSNVNQPAQQKPENRPRTSNANASGSSNNAHAPSKFSGLRRKGKDKMKPFSLAATIYTPLPALTESRSANFIGVVVAYRLPTKAHHGSGDFNMNINIVDPWCFTANDRMSVNIFAKTSDALPAHVAEGMVILFRQVRISYFNGKLVGTVFKDKLSWCTQSLEGQYKQLPGVIVHRQERDHLSELSKWYKETYLGQQGEGTSAAGAEAESIAATITQNLRRTITLDQLQDNSFCHCVAEVVRVFATSDRPEIYITDWTTHPQLQAVNNKDIGWTQEDIERLAEHRGDNGGGSVLKITLWDEQVNAALALQPGHFVHLRNMRCKRSAQDMFEGSMGGNRTQRDFKENKWQIQKLKKADPLLESLLKRKDAAAEELQMERMLAWPESGESGEIAESAEKMKLEANDNNNAGSTQDDRMEMNDTNSSRSAEDARMEANDINSDGSAEKANMEANDTNSDRSAQKANVEANDTSSGESAEKANVGMNGIKRASESLPATSSPLPPTPARLPAEEAPKSAERSSGSYSSDSMSSLAYSMPPPGQRPPAPPSSYPSSASYPPSASVSQSDVPVAQPLTSTPLVHLPTHEEHPPSDLWSSEDEVNAEDAAEFNRRVLQDRADDIVYCRLAKKQIIKMRDIAEGFGMGGKHHIRGRIVDTLPRDMSRWVQVRCSNCGSTLPDTDNFCAPCADEEGTNLVYEWKFAILFQDQDASSKSNVPLIVSTEDGAEFLADFDPAKHRKNVKAQRRLRERLMPIFGAAIDDPDVGRRRSALQPSTGDGSRSNISARSARLAPHDDVSLNPIVDLAVFAYRAPPTGKGNKLLGEIRCKIFGTVLRLKSSRRG
ncbi:hypothetical protein CF327_g37 [Tilletia walkeri]|uniref:Protection of telomeres protein 1 n=1 Tax=Tilletia walkeri TaxID=117179 RepID=A0A8X7NG37_9BASI|nr:hypothetical protein CF327_g37 [Tilletia walkeri]KAE8272282.1 hypothetical protein A4X09_0g55 [Tilletia walkeri]